MQRWTKWLHTTKLFTRISEAEFHGKRPFGLSMPLHVWIPHTYHRTTEKATRQSESIFCCYWNGYVPLLFFVVRVVLLSPPFVFFQPNQKGLENSAWECTSSSSTLILKGKKQKGSSVGCCSFALESIQNHYFWNAINRINDSVDATLLFYHFFYKYKFAGIFVCSWGCSLESAADFLPSCLDYTTVAVHLLFDGRLNGSCLPFMGIGGTAKLFWGNDFVTCFLCVKSHVKYSVFWMELCFSSKIATYSNCMFWVKSNSTYSTLSEDIVSEKWKRPKDEKKIIQSCLPCKRNLEFIL